MIMYSVVKRKKIIVMGFMATCPISGVLWQHLHYLLGLKKLGHDFYYIEDTARLPYNPSNFDVSEDFTYASGILKTLFERFDLGSDKWGFCARYLKEKPSAGLSFEAMKTLYKEADAILNVCGSQELHDELLQSQRLLYIESDPAVEQIKLAKGNTKTHEFLSAHHALFSFGENLGKPDCGVPETDFVWHTTRQPVATEYWENNNARSSTGVFTTIANWETGGKKDIEYNGETYLWSKNPEFHKFVQAPGLCGEPFELCTDMKKPDEKETFLKNGWQLSLPHKLSENIDHYQEYIWNSKGEFTVAKDQYTRLNTGWFSDRSACYLAAGRPVITQETGFSKVIPTGLGLFSFKNLIDIKAAVAEINGDYDKHSRAAACLAKEYFEADKVVADILTKAGVT